MAARLCAIRAARVLAEGEVTERSVDQGSVTRRFTRPAAPVEPEPAAERRS